MERAGDSVRRLGRDELTSDEYADFIGPLFAGKDVGRRIEYMQWLFANNPAWTRPEDLPIYIYSVNGEPAGQLGIVPVEIIFDGARLTAGWCVDLFKGPLARSRSVGGPLVRAAYQDFSVLLSLGQTDQAYNRLCKCGLRDGGRLTLYRALLNRTRTVPRVLLRKAGLARDGSRRSATTPPSHWRGRHGDVEPLHSLSAWELATTQRDASAFSISRTAQFLNWRYLEFPFASYQCLRMRLNGGGEMLAVLRLQQQEGWLKAKLVDAIYPADMPTARLSTALELVQSFAASQGAEQLECRTTDAQLLAALPHSVFTTSSPREVFLYGAASDGEARHAPAEQWKLYASDCDIDLLEAYQAGGDA